jgi:hypothetical protein
MESAEAEALTPSMPRASRGGSKAEITVRDVET